VIRIFVMTRFSSLEDAPDPKNKKPFRAGGRARVSALALREWTRVNPSGQYRGGRAGAIRVVR
jgi:hypothetical protein